MLLVKITIILVGFIKLISSVVVENGVYNGITVGLNSDLSQIKCESIVKAVTNMFQEGNKVLSSAAGLDFGLVYIIIPQDWTSCGSFSIETGNSYLAYNVSDIRIGNADPIFGEEPWTNQPRGCGLPGEFISLSYIYVIDTIDSYKGSRLVHEWAKYRWGVFEEYGHYNDLVYPESSRREGGAWEPNYCTNSPLNGYFQDGCESSSDCHFYETDTPEATSSLLAVPGRLSVNKFCDSSNHRSDIPSKQNLLCNYASTAEIINKHPDNALARTQRKRRENVSATISVKILRENFGVNLVIAYEISTAMDDVTNRFDYETESIAQFITYEAPSSTSLGLVAFDDAAIPVTSKLFELSSYGVRETLSKKVLATKISTSTDINLLDAISESANLLSDVNGIILLLTKCTDENPPSSPTQLATAANGHPVWIILYPKTSDLHLQTYSELAYRTGGMLIPVEEEEIRDVSGMYVTAYVRMKLSEAFRQLLHQIPSFDYRQITYETCPAGEPECSVSFQAPSNFQDPMYIYLYHGNGDDFGDKPDINPSSGTCSSDDELGAEVETTFVFKCNGMGNSPTFDLDIHRQTYRADLIVELIGRPYTRSMEYFVDLKGSTNLFNLRYTANTAPAVYVQISYNGTSIVYANVYGVISQNNNDTSTTIYFRDDGSGADVTGNDGTYSAYLLPVLPAGDFSLSVFADDNDGEARFLPIKYDSTTRVCCGSKINLPSDLVKTNSFGVKNYSAVGTIMESSLDLDLPPGTVMDLRFYNFPSNSSIQFTFTDVGEDLDYGTVNHYMVKIYDDKMNLTFEEQLNITPKASGSTEVYNMSAIACNKVYIVSIYAVDNSGQNGGESNRVTAYVPCPSSSSNTLSAGAWVGIGIAALLIILLFVAGLIYGIYYKDKSKGKGKHSRLASCTCCEDAEDDEPDNRIESSNNQGVSSPPVQQISSIHELINESNLNRQSNQLGQPEDDTYLARTIGVNEMETLPKGDTGGFVSDSFQFSRINKYDSERSLQSIPPTTQFASSHSINNVGVPIRTPTSSVGNFNTFQQSKSHDSLFNTAV